MLWFGSEGSKDKEKANDPVSNLVELGFSFYKNGKAEEAVNYFKQALQIKKRADLYNNLGFIYLHDGKYAKAFNAFRQALHVDGGYLPAFYNLGMVMYYGKSYQDSINIFNDIVKIPELDKTMLLHAYNDRGCALKRSSQAPEAIKSFEAAIALDDTFDRPYANLGNIYVEQGNFDEAKKMYEKAIKANDKCSAAYNGLGVVCVENGQFQEAEKHFDKAIEVDMQSNAGRINKVILKKKKEESQ